MLHISTQREKETFNSCGTKSVINHKTFYFITRTMGWHRGANILLFLTLQW